MPLYVFSCSQGHLTEALARVGVRVISCECGETAQRQQFYPTSIGGRARAPIKERKINGFHAFKEASEEMAYLHDRAEQSAGQKITDTSVWDQARANVKKLQKAGITDSMDYDPRYLK